MDKSKRKEPALIVHSRLYFGNRVHSQKRTFWQWLFRKPVLHKCTYIFEILFTVEASNYLRLGEVILLNKRRWIVKEKISDIRYTIESVTPTWYSIPTIDPGMEALKLYSTAPEP